MEANNSRKVVEGNVKLPGWLKRLWWGGRGDEPEPPPFHLRGETGAWKGGAVTVIIGRNGDLYQEQEIAHCSDPLEALEWGCSAARADGPLTGAHTVAVVGEDGEVLVSVSVAMGTWG